MEAVMPSVDHDTQQIISTYQQIYNLIFKYGIFIILGVLSFTVVLFLDPHAYGDVSELSSPNTLPAGIQPIIYSGNTYIAK